MICSRITLIHKHIRDLYYKKFPELESIVFNSIDYVKCVQKIQNETVISIILNYFLIYWKKLKDLNNVDLQSILTNHQIVAINVAGSSAAGNILSPPELKHILIACDIVLTLDDDKKKVIYIEIFYIFWKILVSFSTIKIKSNANKIDSAT